MAVVPTGIGLKEIVVGYAERELLRVKTTGVSPYWLGVVPYPYEGQIVALITSEGADAYIITKWNAETL